MTRKSLVTFYLVAAIFTLIFQTWVRSQQCINECAVSYAKGAVWSAIWPASWPVYLAGLPAFQGRANARAVN